MKFNKYELETVISLEISENRQSQIIYNMADDNATIHNVGVESINTIMKRLKVQPNSEKDGLITWEVPKKWIRILKLRSPSPKTTWIMTRMPSVQRKMKLWGVEVYNNQGGYLVYNIPQNWIRIRKPRVLSEKQREHIEKLKRGVFARSSKQVK